MSLNQEIEESLDKRYKGLTDEAAKIEDGDAQIQIESSGIAVRIRVAYDRPASEMEKELAAYDADIADAIHEATEAVTGERKTLQRVPRTAMFTAKYER